MASITVNLADNQLETLRALAQRHGIAVDVLLRASLEDWISFQKADFTDAADYVLTKNAELYRRLA